ncbi:kinase non-catalytic C-lobe domain-containing protein 1-like [Lethenteron reissneri]|uniref:kinase non-catalytic C-lobe domain-containing protein 1-like n=1 Tax=Lethenteron reissneri TaxID=7753 RepID=UPI002AB74791|nr:kinase non-catalytic C-lobe domain-containing protein 1-like [Lethenteron reissneri]
MENGAVEMEMAEFIRALRVLNFKAFSYLVKERYPDLYWDDGLLRKLHSRDTMPPLKIQRPSFQKPPPPSQAGVERRIDCTGPEPVTSNAGRGNRGATDMEPGLRSLRSRTWSESTFRQHGTPRSAGKSATPGSGDSRGSGSKVAGRVQCTGPDPAVTSGNVSEVPAPERSPDDQAGIQVWKSVCQKDTGIGEGSGNPCGTASPATANQLPERQLLPLRALQPGVVGGERGRWRLGSQCHSRLARRRDSRRKCWWRWWRWQPDDQQQQQQRWQRWWRWRRWWRRRQLQRGRRQQRWPQLGLPCPSGPQPTCLGWALAFRGEADFNEEIKTYAQTLGRKYGQSAGLEERLQELEQQLMLEKKNLKKTQTYYRKLTQGSVKSKSGGDRGLLFKLTSQMEETQGKVELMHFVRSYLELLTAEQCGLNLYDLPSLKTSRFAGQPSPDSVTTDMGEEEEAEDAMAGDAKDVAPPTFGLLFQAAAPKEGAPKESTAFVHAGTPLGLMSYLYAKNSLSQGYIHQFFYTYRYFVSPQQLLSFIMEQFVNASSVYTPHSSKICQRSMDLLHMWLQTCYRVDFAGDAELTSILQGFILNKVVSYHETAGQHLLHHSSNCDHSRGQGSLSSLEEDDDYAVFSPGPASARASLDIGAARRARDQHKARLPVQQQMSVSGCLGLFRQMSSVGERDTSVYKHSAKSPGAYMLANYTATQIALQLTLLEEVTFKSCLPVHFMNTRAQGVRENLQPGINRLTICSPEGVSLFVPDCKPRGSLWKFLDHSANISTWVSAEILSCDSIKTQLAVLSKFLYVAKTCSSPAQLRVQHADPERPGELHRPAASRVEEPSLQGDGHHGGAGGSKGIPEE